jgi:hypothetical protein
MDSVNRYQVKIHGNRPRNGERATIHLLGASHLRSALGIIHFHDPATTLPDDDRNPLGIVNMHMPIAAFAGVLALLQHDSPVTIDFVDGRGVLQTGEWEKVGETESL